MVEKYIKSRLCGNEVDVLVKWKGYDSSFNSWIPIENVCDPQNHALSYFYAQKAWQVKQLTKRFKVGEENYFAAKLLNKSGTYPFPERILRQHCKQWDELYERFQKVTNDFILS